MHLFYLIRVLWCYLCILLASSQALPLGEPEVQPPANSLGIRLDYDLYKKGTILFSSHAVLSKEISISDKQFKALAVQAYKEMEAMFGQGRGKENEKGKYNIGNRNRPTVMSTLIVDNEIFFSSSIKKATKDFTNHDLTEQDLKDCGGNGKNEHKYQGRCGEVMVFDDFYRSRKGKDLKSLRGNNKVRMVAINGKESNSEPDIVAPCGEGDKWGCNRLTEGLNVLTPKMVEADDTTEIIDWKRLREKKILRVNHPATKSRPVAPPKRPSTPDQKIQSPPKNPHTSNPSIKPPNTNPFTSGQEMKTPPKNPFIKPPPSRNPFTSGQEIKPPSKNPFTSGQEIKPPPRNPFTSNPFIKSPTSSNPFIPGPGTNPPHKNQLGNAKPITGDKTPTHEDGQDAVNQSPKLKVPPKNPFTKDNNGSPDTEPTGPKQDHSNGQDETSTKDRETNSPTLPPRKRPKSVGH